MVLGQYLAYGIVGRREGIHEVKRVREISPQSLFLKSTETVWNVSRLLRSPCLFFRHQSVVLQVFSKLSETRRLKVGAQELDHVRIGQVNLGIVIQPRQPWSPIPLLER